ncbi:MAG: polysaccharide deacetylase family protein [Veillonellaceae bacterium]|jgi:peptidoglycan/xylan/chitin deacetylase (PgdA/CDA1 family)|nr:polysaccharide deacetylase family protein [Veillonellaceae bacterium]
MGHANRLWAFYAFFIALIFIWFILPTSGVPILAYHRVRDDADIYSVSQAQFEEQMKYLADKGYTAVSLAQLIDAAEGKSKLPNKPVVITFDDGYADNLLAALPILEKYRLKATVFVISRSVGQENYLTWEQIKELQARSTEIGSHTASHVALSTLGRQQRESEVRISKAVLEEKLGTPINFIAYPYGAYDAELPGILQQAGYRGACTGVAGLNFAAANPYLLKRVNVLQPKYGLWEFKARLLRAHIYAKLGA